MGRFSSFRRKTPSPLISKKEYVGPIHLRSPNMREPRAMPRGFQLPKIMIASARNPMPATEPSQVPPATVAM